MGSPNSSFANQKLIQVTITLGAGKTFSNGKDSLTLEGIRVSVNIDMGGTFMGGNMRVRIFGLSQSDMNQLTYFAWMPQPQLGPPNRISVTAVDGEQTTLVFTGMIIQAYGNYQAMPEVFLDIQATATQAAQLVSVTPLSVASDTTIATIMGKLAKQMGFTFENNGVDIAAYIPFDPAIAQLDAQGKPISDISPNSPFAVAMEEIYQKILNALKVQEPSIDKATSLAQNAPNSAEIK